MKTVVRIAAFLLSLVFTFAVMAGILVDAIGTPGVAVALLAVFTEGVLLFRLDQDWIFAENNKEEIENGIPTR